MAGHRPFNTLNRRSMLRLMSSVPVVGPRLASKLAAEATAGKLSQLSTSGLGAGTSLPPNDDNTTTLDQRRLALQIPWVRQELEQLLVERNRLVYRIDPDLAVLQSVSLSAKIYYQRQRNIQRQLESYRTQEPWTRIESLFAKVSKLLG